jgi:hypothetical protein
MRYGVVVCPKCKLVKGVDLSKKTSRCLRCGHTLVLSKIKIVYSTDSQEELRRAIGLLNARLDGKSITFEKIR